MAEINLTSLNGDPFSYNPVSKALTFPTFGLVVRPSDPGYSGIFSEVKRNIKGALSAITGADRFVSRTNQTSLVQYAPRFSNEGQYAGVIAGRDAADAVFGDAMLGVPEA